MNKVLIEERQIIIPTQLLLCTVNLTPLAEYKKEYPASSPVTFQMRIFLLNNRLSAIMYGTQSGKENRWVRRQRLLSVRTAGMKP
jgi:hypothetical protein